MSETMNEMYDSEGFLIEDNKPMNEMNDSEGFLSEDDKPMNEMNEWQELKADKDYQININYPHQIRKKSNQKIIKERENNGYIKCQLNGKAFFKHRLIAIQFIPNPDNLQFIDHINKVKADNHISNLRWISQSDNERNKTSYNGVIVEYVDELPNDVIPIHLYKGNEFENIYYSKSTDKCYYNDGEITRILHYNYSRGKYKFIGARDIENKKRSIYIKTWLESECIE